MNRKSPITRSENMSRIRGKDTTPEMLIRSGLHQRGFRFRLHDKTLPGRPDIVLPRYKVAVFVNGCFWHGHNCSRFYWPKSNADFWRDKIRKNRERDKRNFEQLATKDWRVLIIWECSLRGRYCHDESGLLSEITEWLGANEREGEFLERRSADRTTP